MNTPKKMIVIPLALVISGCASMEKSVLLGAAVGGTAGTGIGLGVEKSPGSALIGLGIGAVVGGAFGFLGHKDKVKRDTLAALSRNKKDVKQDVPSLRAPEASCVKKEEYIEGNVYYGPQLICTIEKPAIWTR